MTRISRSLTALFAATLTLSAAAQVTIDHHWANTDAQSLIGLAMGSHKTIVDKQGNLKWSQWSLKRKPLDTPIGFSMQMDGELAIEGFTVDPSSTDQRAYDLLNISYALPADDPRIPVFKTLAAMNATHGYENIGSAGYEGQHLIATYALLYENATKGPAPLAPEKPKGKPGAPSDPGLTDANPPE